MQAIKEITISCHVPAIEQRNREFDVLLIELVAFGQGAGGRAEFHPQVPQFLTETADRIPHRVLGAAVRVKKQNVDV